MVGLVPSLMARQQTLCFKDGITARPADEKKAATLHLAESADESKDEPRQFDPTAPSKRPAGQTTLQIGPRKRQRTIEEIYERFPPDWHVWSEGWQCMEGCDCEFCEYWFGWIIDDTPSSAEDVSSIPESDTLDSQPDTVIIPDGR